MTDLEVHLDEGEIARTLRADVTAGLTAQPKWLPPKWFYDARGSVLFEQITQLDEYYPTRAEREVLATHATDIARITGAKTLIELGSGSSEKTRLLLDALYGQGTLARFVPVDVSPTALEEATAALTAAYPGLDVHGVVADFTAHMELLPAGDSRMVIFLGSTIGNLLPAERREFFRAVRAVLQPGEWLLLGTDLVKERDVLVRAYDDAAGVTAEFNRNVLHVINRELGADFDVDAFEHVAVWDGDREWIEMRLRARRAMQVTVRAIDLEVKFEAGEELRTEISAKFRQQGIAEELAAAGFAQRHWWTDAATRFGVSLAQAS